MTTDVLARARALLDGITSGEWTYYSHEIAGGVWYVATTEGDDIAKLQSREDARFLNAAPPLVRDLVALAEAQAAEIARLRAALRDIAEYADRLGAPETILDALVELGTIRERAARALLGGDHEAE